MILLQSSAQSGNGLAAAAFFSIYWEQMHSWGFGVSGQLLLYECLCGNFEDAMPKQHLMLDPNRLFCLHASVDILKGGGTLHRPPNRVQTSR